MLRHDLPQKLWNFLSVQCLNGQVLVLFTFGFYSFFSAQVLTQLKLLSLITGFHLVTQIQRFQMGPLDLPWRSNRSHY